MRSKIILTIITLFSTISSVYARRASSSMSSSDRIGNTIVEEIQEFITFIMDIFKQYIIEPLMRILKNLFGGMADSIGSIGSGMFAGVRGVMNTAWQELADFLGFLGPFAPIVASAVVWGVVVLSLWVMLDIILDMVLPKPFEEEIED